MGYHLHTYFAGGRGVLETQKVKKALFGAFWRSVEKHEICKVRPIGG